MRQSMTGTEVRIWIRIRGRGLGGWKFRRQHPIGPYFVDFYCPAARLIVEVDGPSHDDWSAAYDARRQAWLECAGYRVLRIPVSVIDQDVESAVDWIAAVLEEQVRLGRVREPLQRFSGNSDQDPSVTVAPPALRATSP